MLYDNGNQVVLLRMRNNGMGGAKASAPRNQSCLTLLRVHASHKVAVNRGKLELHDGGCTRNNFCTGMLRMTYGGKLKYNLFLTTPTCLIGVHEMPGACTPIKIM